MNYIDTLKSVELVLSTGEVPLIVGESGIGKTALAKDLSRRNQWSLIIIDGNLLKEGEIGGLPTIETYHSLTDESKTIEKKTTIYAVHHKLREIDLEIEKGNHVLLFIDEINRCEHTVQQELMNLILNREINGYRLDERVKVLAAMNPSGKYSSEFDYQVVDMDAAQENRFVWLYMESDHMNWIDWAMCSGLEPRVIEFISTFPEYLHKKNAGEIRATPRSYERISKAYAIYKDQMDSIPKAVFLNVLKGNVGDLIAREFMAFIEADPKPLVSFEEVFGEDTIPETVIERLQKESHTRLYLSAKNILQGLNTYIMDSSLTSQGRSQEDLTKQMERLIELLSLYPVDLRIGIMKDIKANYPSIYEYVLEREAFVNLYFEAYANIRK